MKVKELPKSCIETKEEESHTATEHVSKKRKRNHKAVQKNIKAKELMLKRRQRQLKVVKKPEVVDVDEYQASHKSQNEKF